LVFRQVFVVVEGIVGTADVNIAFGGWDGTPVGGWYGGFLVG